MPVILAYVACAVLAALALFQLALIAGAPLGRFAWGGQDQVLPARRKAGSAVSIVLYVVFVLVILQSVGLITLLPAVVAQVATWVVAAVFFASFVMNGISRSPSERAVMAPVSLALAAICVFLAVAGHVQG
jgi:hypothetical protein